MKISARNVLKGTVKEITLGTVDAEIVVQLPGGVEIVSVITRHSAEAMELTTGKVVYTVIKASDVMIGEPHDPKP